MDYLACSFIGAGISMTATNSMPKVGFIFMLLGAVYIVFVHNEVKIG